MDISIIIVNWNTRSLLLDCLASIYKTVHNLTFEILVVDNHSTDSSIRAVKERFPRVILTENAHNLGFAKANNQALRLMNGRYAILLNSDTVLTEGALETLITFMDSHPSAGICGGQLINPDGSRQNSIANIPTLTTELLNKSLLRRMFPEKYPGKEQNYKEPVEVESVIGACMVVRKEAIDDAGLMDESYFFFLEETDWCLSMRKKSWKVFHHPGAAIYHLQGQSAGKINIQARIEYWRSRYIFFEKNYSSGYTVVLRTGLIMRLTVSTIASLLLNFVLLFSSKRSRDKLHLYIRLIIWHLKGCPPRPLDPLNP